jgi:hypothetical protein
MNDDHACLSEGLPVGTVEVLKLERGTKVSLTVDQYTALILERDLWKSRYEKLLKRMHETEVDRFKTDGTTPLNLGEL